MGEQVVREEYGLRTLEVGVPRQVGVAGLDRPVNEGRIERWSATRRSRTIGITDTFEA